jgi:signal transduction histidine kinase
MQITLASIAVIGTGAMIALAALLARMTRRHWAWTGVGAGAALLLLAAWHGTALAAQGGAPGAGQLLTYTLQIGGLALLALGWLVLVPLLRQWRQERIEHRLELRQIRMVTDSVPQILISVDRLQRVRYMNQTGLIWFSTSPADALGTPLGQVAGPEYYEVIESQLEQALTGEPASYDNVPIQLGQQIRHYSICYLPEKNDLSVVQGVHIVIDDVTDQLSALYQLHEADLKMAELAMLRKTSATYAHEINSPLTGILAAADMLADPGMDPEERKELAGDVLQAAKRIKEVTLALERLQDPQYRKYGVGKAQIIELETALRQAHEKHEKKIAT